MTVGNPTLIDVTNRLEPGGSIDSLAMLLSQTNEMLQDMVWVEGNLPTGHRVTQVVGLPTINYRALNEGVTTSKAQTAQIDEQIGILEARSEVDIDLAMLNGNTAAWRMSEGQVFVEAMNQKMQNEVLYGNSATETRGFNGLSSRYNSLSSGNNQNVINGGGANANAATSVWLVCWSDQTIFGIYPKGSQAGLLHEDLGRQTVHGVNGVEGARLEVYADRYQWKCGIGVKDWRYGVRICNLDVSDLSGLTNEHAPSGATPVTTNLLHLMAQAPSRIPNPRMGRCAWYVNRTVFTALLRLALESGFKSGLMLQTAMTEFGTVNNMLSFMGYPIRCVDSILNTEALVA